ncbi:MmcQ/YjbR family DNA-binding protein [Marinifilum sp.]|uniref:MmcQ/YjbR family DNA-binding protein n=1 Tax=Marinifilum sp. TaxID=2033137 RepID=UPI003BA886C8
MLPGLYMNKKYWNTVIIDGSIPDDLLKSCFDKSYQLVIEKMPDKKQAELNIFVN